ncbi:hypothetical protein HDU67_004938 [Dinochytrium kinnereticum]|nr:hypothetical protein HDU67_004938 [Dinochytrium kinnereticum]
MADGVTSPVSPKSSLAMQATNSTAGQVDVIEVMFNGVDSDNEDAAEQPRQGHKEPATISPSASAPKMLPHRVPLTQPLSTSSSARQPVSRRPSLASSITSRSGNTGGLTGFGTLLLGDGLGDSSSTVTADVIYYLEPEDIAADESIPDDVKKARVTASFIRACSNGDIGKVGVMLGKMEESITPQSASVKDWIDINGKDEDGTPAIVYAACWGHADIIRILLESGANIDDRDKNGWTALLWACSNGHEDAAKVLLQGGASKDLKSNRGRSLQDIVKRDASKQMRKILELDPVADSASDVGEGSSTFFFKSSSTSMSLADSDSGSISSDRNSTYMKRWSSTDDLDRMSNSGSNDDPYGDTDGDDDAPIPFDWDKCSLDQMLVFDEKKLDGILKVAVVNLQPLAAQSGRKRPRPVPANIILLCARYAHYWNSVDFLDEFFGRAFKSIIAEVQKNPDDNHLMSHWIANCAQLIRYLRRDPGLRSSTTDHQATLTELIHELYAIFTFHLNRQIDQILDAAILESGAREAIASVRFDNAFTGFGRRKTLLKVQQQQQQQGGGSNKRASISAGGSPLMSSGVPTSPNSGGMAGGSPILSPTLSPQPLRKKVETPKRTRRLLGWGSPYQVTPRSIVSILDSSSRALRSAGVHPSIIRQALAQALTHLNAEIFNRILTSKDLHCRSRAMQVRLNISVIEDWCREMEEELYGDGLLLDERPVLCRIFRPSVQICKFLQVISSLQDLGELLETMAGLDAITIPQAGRTMVGYRYEINEPSFPEEVEAYVIKVAEDIRRVHIDNAVEVVDDDVLEGLLDPHIHIPFHLPPLSGTDADVGWVWSKAVPFIPEGCMRMLDQESLEDLGDGWDGAVN